jgi:hypothetical protein
MTALSDSNVRVLPISTVLAGVAPQGLSRGADAALMMLRGPPNLFLTRVSIPRDSSLTYLTWDLTCQGPVYAGPPYPHCPLHVGAAVEVALGPHRHCPCKRCRSWAGTSAGSQGRGTRPRGLDPALAARATICALHAGSYATGLPPGGLHPICADHCPEREPSRAWSAGLPRCFGR